MVANYTKLINGGGAANGKCGSEVNSISRPERKSTSEMGGKRPFAKVLESTVKSPPMMGGTVYMKLKLKEVKPPAKPLVSKLKSTMKVVKPTSKVSALKG